MDSRNLLAALLLTTVSGGLVGPAAAQEDATAPPEGLSARIEVRGNYYRIGEPIDVRVNLENLSGRSVPNPEGVPLLPALELEVNGEPVRPVGHPAFDPATQPRAFPAGSSVTQIIDLAPLFPALTRPGTYKVRFRSGEIVSESTDFSLAPPYDPDLDYRATLKTDAGDLEVDLLESSAPEHVQNFVDLARMGYYDGTYIFFIAQGEMFLGGSPEKDGTGGVPWGLAPEIGNLPMERGMMFSVRTSFLDNGNQFAIAFRRNPDRDGKFSMFGKVIGGEATLTALEKVSTSGNQRAPFFQPLTDTFVRTIVIETADGAGEDAAAEESGN